jgi:hypothetical protein
LKEISKERILNTFGLWGAIERCDFILREKSIFSRLFWDERNNVVKFFEGGFK